MAGEMSKQDQVLTKGAQLTQSARGDLDQQLNSLRGKLGSIGAQWQGGGSTAFQTAMQRWDESARKITTALDQFEANLKKSEQTYDAADDQQQSIYGGLAGRLD